MTKVPFRNKTIQFLKENNLSQRQLQQLDSYSLMEEFIQDGKGIAFLPIKMINWYQLKMFQLKN